MNTLARAGTTLVLPDEMAWPNEFGWSPVEQSTERRSPAVKLAGVD